MTEIYSLFNIKTGIVVSHLIAAADQLAANTPEGFSVINGRLDPLSQRIDIATGEAIDYQPPQPSTDHEWNVDSKRWQLRQEVVAKLQGIINAQVEIDALERKQLRAMRELALDSTNADAQSRLKSIDEQIAIQRAVITVNQSS